MSIDNLRGVSAFVKAVEGGSIAAAARQLGISAAAASQNIARLEAQVGSRLLQRTTRSLALTDAGQVYFDRVRELVLQLENAQAAAAEFAGQPQGHLRVASSVAFGRHVVAPLLPAFMAAFPQVSVELVLTDRNTDHLKEGLDASIRFKAQLEPGLVARRLAVVPLVFCAAPAYLQRAGTPAGPHELQEHVCLVCRMANDGRILPWPFLRDGERFEPVIRRSIVCNDIDALAAMAVAGAGVTRLATFVVRPLLESGALVPLFTRRRQPSQADPEPLEFYACFQERRHVPPKLRAFVDFLARALHGHPALSLPAQSTAC